MLNAVLTSLRDIPTPPFRAVLWKSIGLTLALLAVVWIGTFAVADYLVAMLPVEWQTAADWLAGLLLFVGLGFLVAPVTALFAGLYADEVAEVVERTRYPTERPGVSQSLMIGFLSALRFTGFVVLVNIAMLPLLFLPGINVPIFLIVNAYLLGREYFEQAAMRFRSPEDARVFRSAHSGKVMLGGLTIAALLAIPVVNILTPLYATALMVHVVKLAERQDRA
ncbi:cysteine biosynthesis protein CysZ [Pleomorphomonas diazotrophica]|uniref:Cysteine biosynthesis protein CysZ n=1 Tax=Pleomorphomonas diazotrophica TaxID=1166257 RepID=A0A1I4SSY3_9HYPH|nr:sulfate transporter family protein [Pleomorphomonas diazotrophica]PKR88509.1 cysteine biosynthesis protein CysZ [Pleomorphomonas diazotrophica]SFM67487.1 CysZ protein [Pleomorphomonas diazotrophica]